MKKIIKFLLFDWNEFLSIPLGFAMFFGFPFLLRVFDPTAAAYDGGILHSFIAAICGMLIIHGFVWLLLKITFPRVYNFFDNDFENYICQNSSLPQQPTERDRMFHLTAWQRCVLSLSLFSLYLLCTVLLAKIF